MKPSSIFLFIFILHMSYSCKKAPKKYSDLEIVPALQYFTMQNQPVNLSSCGDDLDENMTKIPLDVAEKYNLYRFTIEPLQNKRYKITDPSVSIHGHTYWKLNTGYLLLYSTTIDNEEMEFNGVESRLLELGEDGSIVQDRFYGGYAISDDMDIIVCQNLKFSDGQYGLEINQADSENIPEYLNLD